MTCGLVQDSYSLPGWQAVKLTFLAPCLGSDALSEWNFCARFSDVKTSGSVAKCRLFSQAIERMDYFV